MDRLIALAEGFEGDMAALLEGKFCAPSFLELTENVAHLISLRAALLPLFQKDQIEATLTKGSKEQKNAVINLLSQKIAILSGIPGSGKSFTAALMMESFSTLFQKHFNKDPAIVIAAPTGKAAALLGSKAPKSAHITTLHRLLGKKRGWREKRLPFLAPDLLLVDEASMVDPFLASDLLLALSERTSLILIGDPWQLPAVAGGTLFSDLCKEAKEKKKIPFAALEHSHRTASPHLRAIAEAVREGNFERFMELAAHPSEEFFWGRSLQEMPINPESIYLTPMEVGPYGIIALEEKLKESFKGSAVPIISTRNQASGALMNGEMGKLIDGKLIFESGLVLDERVASYRLAFALSIHKSQGSEFDRARALFPKGSERFNRSLLYTAITRAKSHLEIYAEEETLRQFFNE